MEPIVKSIDFSIELIQIVVKNKQTGKCTLSPSLQKQFDGWGKDTNQLIILCKKKSKTKAIII